MVVRLIAVWWQVIRVADQSLCHSLSHMQYSWKNSSLQQGKGEMEQRGGGRGEGQDAGRGQRAGGAQSLTMEMQQCCYHKLLQKSES